MTDTVKTALITALLTISLCAIGAFTFYKVIGINPAGETTLTLNAQEHTMTISAKGGSLNIDELLKQITSSPYVLDATAAWFRQNKQMYSVTDHWSDLVQVIASMCPDPGSGADPSTIDTLNNCFRQHPILQSLRSLATDHDVPFEVVADEVTIGVPSDIHNQPEKRRANGCGDGKYFAHKVQIYDRGSSRQMTVMVSGRYRCSVALTPDLQLNPADAIWLFGNSVLKRTQKAYALLLYE